MKWNELILNLIVNRESEDNMSTACKETDSGLWKRMNDGQFLMNEKHN